MSNEIKKSLIICQTPFQLILARAIMGDRVDYDLLIVIENNSNYEKIKYYVNFFKNKNINIKILKVNNRGVFAFKSLFEVYLYVRKNLKEKYNIIYFASIHNLYIQSIISMLDFNTIETFDDGTGNINRDGVFYVSRYGFKNKILRFIFKIEYNIERIKLETKLHYTIYQGVGNIVEDCKYINLFKKNINLNLNQYDQSDEISIFIGQPLELIKTKIDYDILSTFVNKTKIDYYYPHPGETSIIECKKIISPLIAEEYILNLLEENPMLKINIYGFFSGVLLNIISLQRVKVYALHDDVMYKKYYFLYSMLSDMGGILLNIEDSI